MKNLIHFILTLLTALGGGECIMAPGQVNPLGLLNHPGLMDSPFEARPSPRPVNATRTPHTRRKRDLEMVVRSEPYVDRDGRRLDIVNMVGLMVYTKIQRAEKQDSD